MGIMCGYFRPDKGMPWILRILNYILPTKYAAEFLAINEFEHRTYTCPGSQALPGGLEFLNTNLIVGLVLTQMAMRYLIFIKWMQMTNGFRLAFSFYWCLRTDLLVF